MASDCDGRMYSHALELVPFMGVELSSPLGIKCATHSPLGYSVRCFNPHPPRDEEGDLTGLVPVARTTILIDQSLDCFARHLCF